MIDERVVDYAERRLRELGMDEASLEREACALLVEGWVEAYPEDANRVLRRVLPQVAAAIRARGKS